jgi:DNA-binding GntR family transcriptional regulator
MGEFEPLTPRQLKDEAYSVIKDAITSLRFQPGAMIVEGHLAQSLGISKTPIRMALVRLEHEGFVETRRASGTYVRRMSFEDVREVFEVRLALELCAIDRLAGVTDLGRLETLRTNIAQGGVLIADSQESAAFDALNEFHLLMVDLAGNHRLSQTYRSLFDHIVRIGNVCGRIPGLNERSLGEHGAFVEALVARDAGHARALISQHIANVLEDYRRSGQSSQFLEAST